MTLFAAFGVYVVRKDAGLSFWLAIAAHVQIMLGLTAFTALFVKRSISAGRDGVKIEDQGDA